MAILDVGIERLATLIFNVALMPPSKLWFRKEMSNIRLGRRRHLKNSRLLPPLVQSKILLGGRCGLNTFKMAAMVVILDIRTEQFFANLKNVPGQSEMSEM